MWRSTLKDAKMIFKSDQDAVQQTWAGKDFILWVPLGFDTQWIGRDKAMHTAR